VIRLTRDGGLTWEGDADGAGIPFCRVSAVDADTVWYLSPNQTPDSQLSTDAGETWTEFPLPEDIFVYNIVTISLRTRMDGYLLYKGGDLYITADGGRSWNKISLPLGKYGEMKLEANNSVTFGAVRFLDADDGIVIVDLFGGGDSKVVALTTTDGGQTWQEEIVPATLGSTYLSRDGKYLTIQSVAGKITVLRHNDT